MSCTECLKCPYFHFPKPLSSKLCFTAKRLLGDKGIRSDRTGMHFIVNHMAKFHHIDYTYCSRLVETFACASVEQISLSVLGKFCLFGILCDLVNGCPVEDGGR